MSNHYAALTKVFHALSDAGMPIYTPTLGGSDLPFDLIALDEDLSPLRVSVRYRTPQRGKIEIAIRSKDVVDVYAVYCPDTDSIYYVNRDEIEKKAFVLRVEEPKRQLDNINYAQNYTNIERIQRKVNYIMYEMQILVEGKPLTQHQYQNKTWLEANDNAPFEIMLRNRSNQKALFVVSVDGKNVITGEKASKDGDGYVVHPRRSVRIDGWRKSLKQVAEFFFTRKEASYSGQVGDGDTTNCGVIGCAIFNEKRVYRGPEVTLDCNALYEKSNINMPLTDMYGTSQTSDVVSYGASDIQVKGMMDSDSVLQDRARSVGRYHKQKRSRKGETEEKTSGMLRSAPDHSMGTGWGDTKVSHVTEVTFDREESPTAVLTFHYDSYENLVRAGIIRVQEDPNPFPADSKFCAAP